MVYVPAGALSMGSEGGQRDEAPVHAVQVDAFWIDRFEVTNQDFAGFVSETAYRTDAEIGGWGSRWDGEQWTPVDGVNWQHPQSPDKGISRMLDHPVVQVSWNDARNYCTWAGGRLPTEAEWEMAAIGTTEWRYPWGDGFDPDKLNASGTGTEPVGGYPDGKSPYGAHDMAGNVWEWVSDWYQADYYARSPQAEPQGPATGTRRVLRGGGWDPTDGDPRSANRGCLAPSWRGNAIGFRCVQNPPSARAAAGTPTSPESCSFSVDPQLAGAYDPDRLGCPTGAAQVTWAAWERFQGGHTFWRADTDETYVLYFREAVGRSAHTWQRMPEEWKWDLSNPDGLGMTPPAGLHEPKRGFGWLWRTHLGGPDGSLGWATEAERGFCALVQPFGTGLMLKSSSMPSCQDGLYNWATHPSFDPLLFALYSDGTWREH